MTRAEMLLAADAILRSNPEPPQPAVRVRYRGTRPAFNWLAKQDERAAAALWLVARRRLPSAANDNLPTAANDSTAHGQGVDRRKDGKPRGRNPDPRSLEAYIAMPSIQPRFGDAEPAPVRFGNWDGESRGITIKPQREVFDFHPDCRFGYCAPAIAGGAIFLGAEGGLGQPKIGKQRGDARRVGEPDAVVPPNEVDTVIEVMLSGGSVADVGKALGARGGYADRRGGRALLAAGKWAEQAIAA